MTSSKERLGPSTRPAIVYLSVSGNIGGVDTYILNNARLLMSHYEILVVVGYRKACRFYRQSGIERVLFMPLTRPNALVHLAKLVCELRRLPIATIHTNDLLTCLWGKVVCALIGARSRHVTTIHSVVTQHRIFGPVKRRVVFGLNRLLRNYHQQAYISVSQTVRDSLEEVAIVSRNMPVIYNGIDLMQLAPADKRFISLAGIRRVGFVGRLSHEKGPDLFLECVRNLPERYEIHVYGDGDLRRLFTEEAAPRLRVHGFVADKPRIYSSLDVVCITSRTEALPYVLLEALAAGCRVLALWLPIFDEMLDGSPLKSDIVCANIDEMRERIENDGSGRPGYDGTEVGKLLERFDNQRYTAALREVYRMARAQRE